MQELNMKNSLDANLVQMSANYCLVYVAISAALFYRLSTHFLPMYIPYSVVEKNKQWMFKNICNSFVHSSISSIWIAFCLWNYPAHRYDFINVYSNQSYLLLCFSVGYFLYDLLDMYINDRDSSLHLLVHHLVVIGVFGVAIYSRYYLGYAMVGLLVEVNSVFLHMRTLMRVSGYACAAPRTYRTVCWLNLGTFIVFRIYLLAYLTHWLFSHRQFLNPNLFLFTLPCLVTINVMSWLLFAKICVEDFASHLIKVSRWLGATEWVESLQRGVARAEAEGASEGDLAGKSEEAENCEGAVMSEGAANKFEGAASFEHARLSFPGRTRGDKGPVSDDSSLIGGELTKDSNVGRLSSEVDEKLTSESDEREKDLREAGTGEKSKRASVDDVIGLNGGKRASLGDVIAPLFTVAHRFTDVLGLGSTEDLSGESVVQEGCEFRETEGAKRGKVKAS